MSTPVALTQYQSAVRPDQVAQILGISRAKVYELLAAGSLPSFKIGRVRLVLLRDIDRYLCECRVQAMSAAPDEQRVSE